METLPRSHTKLGLSRKRRQTCRRLKVNDLDGNPIDANDRRWFPASHDGSAQGSGATTDIEPSLLDRNGEPVEKFGCDQAAPPTDVGLIGVAVCPYVMLLPH